MDTTAQNVADQLLALGGPHDPDAVVETARAVAELVRWLNHATFHTSALQYPSHLYAVVGALNAAVWGLEQTFGQLATRLDRWADDPRLRHDEFDANDHAPAANTAAVAADDLRQAATHRPDITRHLESARALTSHLAYREDR
jgi:hypothetical protein